MERENKSREKEQKPPLDEIDEEFNRVAEEVAEDIRKPKYRQSAKEVEASYNAEVNRARRDKFESGIIISFINDCLNKYKNSIDSETTLDDFLDFIEGRESNIKVSRVNKWISTHNTGPDMPLDEFLKSVADKGVEADYLLNPGPES